MFLSLRPPKKINYHRDVTAILFSQFRQLCVSTCDALFSPVPASECRLPRCIRSSKPLRIPTQHLQPIFTLRADDWSMYGKKASTGLICAKTKKYMIIGYYEEGIKLDNTNTVEKLPTISFQATRNDLPFTLHHTTSHHTHFAHATRPIPLSACASIRSGLLFRVLLYSRAGDSV